MRAVFAALVALVATLGFSACNGETDVPDELSRADAGKLVDARRSLDAVLKTEAKLSSSPQTARRLRERAQAIVSEGSLEAEEIDEFGLAALGRLQLVAPSLVDTDSDGVPEALDADTTRAFLRHAESDPAQALLPRAEEIVGIVERTVEGSEAGPGTRIAPDRPGEATPRRVAGYLQQAEDDLQPVWPGLSGRLHVLREGL